MNAVPADRLAGRAFLDDPYPAYRDLLEAGRPLWLPLPGAPGVPGMWLFCGYDVVSEILSCPGFISKEPRDGGGSLLDSTMLNRDPPDHTRLRGSVGRQFGAPAIRALEARILQVVDGLIDRVETAGRMEFIADFAMPLPVTVVKDLLGIPDEDIYRLYGLSAAVLSATDSILADAEARRRRSDAESELAGYFHRLIDRPQGPAPLLRALADARDRDSALSAPEAASNCFLLLVAGFETTIGLLGNGLLTLLRWPEQMQELRDDPGLLPTAVEEMLRFESPLQRATYRVTTAQCELKGQALAAGEQVCAVIGAANRDPAQFPDPHTFDIARTPNRHLAFGFGIHTCLGAALARTEARIAFRRILDRFPRIQLVPDGWEWGQSTFMRRLARLEVEF